MSKVKNVSGGPLDVPLLERIVEDGEIVEVPDVQADGVSPIVWPANRWQPVAEAKSGARTATPAADTSGKAPA